jgi:hypothetical protein
MSRANEIAMKYLAGVHGALRKQNTAKLKPGFKNTETVAPDDMGDNAELGDDDISSLLESTTSAENEMGDGFTSDGKDVGSESDAPSDDMDQAAEGSDPKDPSFKKKLRFLSKG